MIKGKIMIKRVLAAAAALTLLAGCSAAVVKNEITPPVKPISSVKPDIEQVADAVHESDWYYEMCISLMEYKFDFTVSERVGNRDLKKAMEQLRTDFPDIFWRGNSYHATSTTDGSKISISKPDFIDDEGDLPAMHEELYNATCDVIKKIPEGSSDYEKALFVYDYIMENTVYDHEGAKSEKRSMCHTSYGCLVEGKAVCEGYAAAFTYIMQMLNIESGVCTGSNHAWNYINLDGEYYWLDATWDDNDRDNSFGHTYFLINDEMLLRTRSFDLQQGFVPECTSLELNYYVQNGGFFESYDEKKVIDYISECSDEESCTLIFADFESYESALYSLLGDYKVRKADGIVLADMQYRRNDDMYAVEIVY